jgi:SAM-dependent methyltransferase
MSLEHEVTSAGSASTDRTVRNCLMDAKRQGLRDCAFMQRLERYLRPGRTLEIGAATGQLSAILQQHGYDVVTSDVAPKFLEAIAARGLKTLVVDATQNIIAQTGESYANILAQAVIPLIRRDRDRVMTTLRAIHSALEPSGRLLCISPYAWRQPDPQAFFSPKEQMQIVRASGLFEPVVAYPHQVVTPGWYAPWNAAFLNMLDHKLAWIASVRWVWVMEKRSGGPM